MSGVLKSTMTSAVVEDLLELDPEAGIGPPGELHVLGALDGAADGLTHPPRRSGDSDLDHAVLRNSLTGASALRKQSSSEPMQAAERRSAP